MAEERKKIVVDYSRCAGNGVCESEAPHSFEVQDDATLLVLDDSPAGDEIERVEAAVEFCPMAALKLVRAHDAS